MERSTKILIVEDNFLIAEEMRLTLTGAGHVVVGTTGNPDQALVLAERHHPDLAIVNLGLTDWQAGASIASRLSQRDARLRIILCTGFPDTALERAGIGALVSEVVHKPWSTAELLGAIDRCLGGRTEKR